MFSFLLFLTAAEGGEQFVKTQYKQCPGQTKQYFQIKKFEIYHPLDTRGMNLVIQLIAELNHKVQEPYLEVQLINSRIPFQRLLDPLCRPGILICPASFSQVVYGVQIPVPPTLPVGNYNIRLIFRERNDRLACYEAPINVKDLDIEKLHREEYDKWERQELEALHDESEDVE
ncbi:hypothetical protein TVAG_342840 [Trichomonas vaginalis G3]|uniref:MD-2-related lipid-recognition domain-containing protein n=1 Tax=Trichomonas vaginalis (strain ATCC PRA-98 / G3) TaxID=412133 RepID=A2EJP6_TRIV3|nr:E set domains family [Trichomonas vaginalis G3]EAY07120.1 hypothetical protein TVAG_342840 [Trichomonas vaginalis G3]KAI5522475.1 E set domains family [Trichomonas vaginalis G3]|eukprot:XP_001319343.1 hypothetical protein [Trichomonas vaginalis G3]